MKTVATQTVSKSSLPVVFGAVDLGTRLFDQLLTWHQRVQDRQALNQLDAHMLHDIGLSRADVEHEVSKPFWQG
jgi:uncharacterized protein YjiS (DUF1127 family)